MSAEVLLILTTRDFFRNASVFCLWIGAPAAAGVALLGWFHAGFTLTDDDWVQTTHRWLGTFTAAVALVALVLQSNTGSRARTRWARAALFLTAGAVSVTGFFGGALVFGINHYAW